MSPLNRREFLQATAAGTAALVLPSTGSTAAAAVVEDDGNPRDHKLLLSNMAMCLQRVGDAFGSVSEALKEVTFIFLLTREDFALFEQSLEGVKSGHCYKWLGEIFVDRVAEKKESYLYTIPKQPTFLYGGVI